MSTSDEVVYVVDDDARIREGLAQLLESRGMRALCFGSAAEYLDHVRSDGAACLVLDLQLPGIGGLELQQRLAGEAHPPIVFISGRGDIPTTVKAMKAGAVEFLTKPVDPEALLAAITGAFSSDRAARAQRAELAELRRRFSLLSPREREVLPLVAAGLLNKQAASRLRIREVTLQIHRSSIMRKMAAESFADLVRMAEKLGIPPRP